MSDRKSVFAHLESQVYPFTYRATLAVDRICGGVPSNPLVAEAWLRSKLEEKDEVIASMVKETMDRRVGVLIEAATKKGLDAAEAQSEIDVDEIYREAVEEVTGNRHLKGFCRDEQGLYIEGRCVKACLKEAFNIRYPKQRWGISRKGTLSYVPEHVLVPADKIHLGVFEPSEVSQRFVHTWRGSGIALEEVVNEAEISFLVQTDVDFDHLEKDLKDVWAAVWLTAERQGLGATRSQGFGRFTVVGWDRVQ